MARIPYVDPESASQDVRDALDALPPLNIFRMLANADSAFVPYIRFGGVVLTRLELDPQLRELAILLVARHDQAEYEWVQHVAISLAIGTDQAKIDALERGDLDAEALTAADRAVLRFTAAVLEGPHVDDETFAELREHLPPRQIVELLLTAGSYHMLARIMTVLDLDLDPPAGAQLVDRSR